MHITISWQAFGDIPHRNRYTSQITFEFASTKRYENRPETHRALCNMVYMATNLQADLADFGYTGDETTMWNRISPILPAHRTHTSLSAGDEVTIHDDKGEVTYRVEDLGWSVVKVKEFANN